MGLSCIWVPSRSCPLQTDWKQSHNEVLEGKLCFCGTWVIEFSRLSISKSSRDNFLRTIWSKARNRLSCLLVLLSPLDWEGTWAQRWKPFQKWPQYTENLDVLEWIQWRPPRRSGAGAQGTGGEAESAGSGWSQGEESEGSSHCSL